MSEKKKIIFLGTPDFAKEVLVHLLTLPTIDVVAVVCQPDRKQNRKKEIVFSPVKEVALAHQLPLFQPSKVGQIVDELKKFEASALISCAYGQFIPSSLLNYSALGVINIHASLLPKYRGGAPMEHALMNGEKETGISLMKSSMQMDQGPVYMKDAIKISDDETRSSLESKLIALSKRMLTTYLDPILNGELLPKPQDDRLASLAPTIQKDQEWIDFNRTGIEVYNHIKALIDRPYGYILMDGIRVKLIQVNYVDHNYSTAGQVVLFDKDHLIISCQTGAIEVVLAQPAGKTVQNVAQLYNGYQKQWKGKILDEKPKNSDLA